MKYHRAEVVKQFSYGRIKSFTNIILGFYQVKGLLQVVKRDSPLTGYLVIS